ncbi:F-box family protein [Arabidopsis lyrata subsp. lyrata]|uniref:F-box family protein n=1 Tax=Arabidopsis lyrata subsp. lyrata TaxID=81972 RepID=D7L006_ARALL|nr:F-box family protein [Arabidopsis lyrata subsp. lyrata]
MMFNYLPEDMVVEILSRVPAVSLARLRSTSKIWNALIKDGRLAKKHSANAPRHSMALVLIDHRVYLVRSNLREIHNNVAPFVSVTCHFSLKERLSKHFSTEVDIRDVFHCDGLLLCTTKDYRLVVWNPCSGETRWIQPRDSYKKDDCYALGRSSCNKYKILRQELLINPSQESYVYNIVRGDFLINNNQERYEYEIYDFTSNSWRGVGVSTGLFNPNITTGMSVNGIIYWFDITEQFLLSFDFSTERFGSESLPEDDSHLALSVTRQGKQLCMLSTHSSYVTETNVNLWIATKSSENTEAMSWSKFPILRGGVGLRYRYHFREGVSFFAYQVKEKIVVVSCHRPNRHSKNIIHIAGHGKFIELDHHGAKPKHEFSPTPLLLVYVPSLVQIQHGI